MTVSEKLQVVVAVLLGVFGVVILQHGLVSSTSARAVRDAAAFFSAWPTYTIEFF